MRLQYFSILPILAIIFFGAQFLIQKPIATKIVNLAEKEKIEKSAGSHRAASFNKEFYGGLEDAPPLKNLSEPVYGGIVSHHLAASREIAEFFAGLKDQKIETIVIVNPLKKPTLIFNEFIVKFSLP